MEIYNWKDISLYPESTVTIGTDSIAQSIYNLLSVHEGELIFNPEFGCALENLLFEPMDFVTEHRIKEHLIDCLERWEPRIKINPGRSSVVSDPDRNMYDIILIFKVAAKSSEKPEFSYSFSLKKKN